MRQNVMRLFMLMAGVALVGVAAPAHAQSISACVGASGVPRIVPAGTVCRPAETLVTWGTRAAGPCFDNFNRYVDCGNGTVTDTVTGLIWLKRADCFGTTDWAAANQAAAALKDGDCTLTDRSSKGDWRLPTHFEWFAMLERAITLSCFVPALTNDAGTGCYGLGAGTSITGVATDAYWSSTAFDVSPNEARFANLYNGDVGSHAAKVLTTVRVWPVRGGPR